MKASEKTKYKLANALKHLMEQKALDKITITEIVKVCDVTRQTFYRHFLDKYDLVNWYFDVLASRAFEQMGISLSLREGLLKKFELMKDEKVFFISAFSSEEQNCLIDHDYEYIYQFYSSIIKKNTGSAISEKIDFLLRMYCRGSIIMTAEWARSGMDAGPAEIVDDLLDAMPPKLYELLKNL